MGTKGTRKQGALPPWLKVCTPPRTMFDPSNLKGTFLCGFTDQKPPLS